MPKHQDLTWLAGLIFIKRGFIEEAEEKGLETFFERAPYGDLTEQEKAAFRDSFNNPRLRKVVQKWWKVYDEERAEGKITKAASPWSIG